MIKPRVWLRGTPINKHVQLQANPNGGNGVPPDIFERPSRSR